MIEYKYVKVYVKYKLIIQYFSMLGASLMRKSTFLEESGSIDPDPQQAVAGFFYSPRDFCVVTLSLIFSIKGSISVSIIFICFIEIGKICLQIHLFLVDSLPHWHFLIYIFLLYCS